MSTSQKRALIAGSERSPLPGARAAGPVDPHERLEVTVVLRPRAARPHTNQTALSAQPLHERRYLSRDEFEAMHGADPGDIQKVEAFARHSGLEVAEVSQARRAVVLSGTVQALERAFGVRLTRYEHEQATYRGQDGVVSIPLDLEGIVEGVFGLDDRPQARTQYRMVQPTPPGTGARATGTSFTPVDIAALYDFPAGTDGQGQCIALIELGGGYRTQDLQAYFARLGITQPQVTEVSVDQGQNSPGAANSADGEVMLDIEVAGAVAPGSRIVVYFAPNTDRGFLDAITTAIHDTANKPSIVSISWGGPESSWTAQALQAFDQAFQDAGMLGVTVCCAAGDSGSDDGVGDGQAHVDFPAASPQALACGGTRLEAANGTIAREVVWNDGTGGGATGGGVSETFSLPSYQTTAGVPPSVNAGKHIGRGVPDVAGDASPATGYQIQVDGQQIVIGGTSAVAPLWAGLIARMNQHLGTPVGFLHPLLYGPTETATFHDITVGNNGAYSAGLGWDACTGLGTPDGARLLAALATGK
ncbi:MAG: S53 family peptidase [Chloroflexota bacterium]